MIVSVCTADRQALGSHKEHTPGTFHVQITAGSMCLWESKAAADLTGGGAQVAMWAIGVAVHTDDAVLTPAMWPGSWQGLGTPVLHHPYLVLSRFIKQLDISLIHLRRVGCDLVTERLSDLATETVSPGQTQCHCHGPPSQLPSTGAVCSPFVLWIYFLSFWLLNIIMTEK